jgi:7-cyano-7-deazaguanine synthase in queuosine biosynthesis
MNKVKNILLLSGGNDSMYIYHKYNHKYNVEFECIYFNYGQPYFWEEIKRLPEGVRTINIDGKLKIDKKGYVSGRNMIFLIEIAREYEGKIVVWMGSNKDDVFPDNNEKYLLQTVKLINIGFNSDIHIKLPLKNKSKKDIMKYIINNNIDTYSCYKGGEKRCGKCKACLSVINATKNT